MAKTQAFAQEQNVSVHTQVADALDIHFDTQFDAVGLVFSHMPADCRALFHHRAWTWVKPGGRLIVEGFTVTNSVEFWGTQDAGHAV